MKLLSLTAEIYVNGEQIHWTRPLRLGVAIDGRDFLRVRERSGDSIQVDSYPLAPAILGEGRRIEVHDITERVDPTLRGADVLSVRFITLERRSLIGVALLIAPGRSFCIWSHEDEFYLGSQHNMRSMIGEARGPTIGRLVPAVLERRRRGE